MSQRQRPVTHLSLMDLHGSIEYKEDIQFEGWVTSVVSPDEFYVRHVKYDQYLHMLRQRGKKIGKYDMDDNKKVVFKLATNGQFGRGVITAVNMRTETCTAFAIDYGLLEVDVPFNHFYYPKELIYTPGLAVKCNLAEFKPRHELNLYTEKMKEYVLNKKVKIRIMQEPRFNALVVRVTASDGSNLAAALNKIQPKIKKSNKKAKAGNKSN